MKSPPSEYDITIAATFLLEAANQGSQDAVRHLARLAICCPNSPVSLERVLELCMMQRQRPRQHCLKFTVPLTLPEDEETAMILETLDRLCLNGLWGNNPETPLGQFIKSELNPALIALIPKVKGHEAKAKLCLLVSHACKGIGEEGRLTFFKGLSPSKMSPQMVYQWGHHLAIGPSDDPIYQMTCDLHRSEMNNLCRQFDLCMPAVPYIIYTPCPTKELFKQFEEWNAREGSWLQLPVLIGTIEMQKWFDGLPSTYSVANQDGEELYSISFPGKKEKEKYECLIQTKVMTGFHTGEPLEAPIPRSTQQKRISQHWHDFYTMEVKHIAPQKEQQESSQSAATSASDSASATTPSKKKKKKKKATAPSSEPDVP